MKNFFFTSFILLKTCFLLLAQPLSGTYTIGGNSPDFSTINAAVNALNTNGVNGPTVFNIRNGSYLEILYIHRIPGVSPTNTVLFKGESGDSSLVTINGVTTSNQQNSLRLDSVSYTTFRHLTVQQPASVNNNAVVFIFSGKYTTFENCVLWGTTSSSSSATEWVIQGVSDSSFVVRNSVIRGATSGIYVGNTRFSHRYATIENNTFLAVSEAIFVDKGAFVKIMHNDFSNGGGGTGRAILLQQTSRSEIAYNKIVMLNGGLNSTPVQVISSSGWPLQPAKFYNNTIRFVSGTAYISYGMRFSSSSNWDIANNTVTMTGGKASYVLYGEFYDGGNDTTRIRNNNFVRLDTSFRNFLVYIPNITAYNIISKNNNLFTNAPRLTPQYTTLAAYQAATGKEQNSMNVDPQLVSPTDLRSQNPLLQNVGVPISHITDDINGVPRSPTRPDLGAFEVLDAPIVNLGNDTTACVSVILDAGAAAGARYLWSNGAATQTISINIGGNYWVQVSNAAGTSSDSINVTLNPIFPSQFTINGNILEAMTFWGATYQWYLNGVAIPNSNTATYTITQSGSYSLMLSVNGCSSMSSPQNAIFTNIQKQDNQLVKIYPNPATDYLYVDNTEAIGAFFIELYNDLGQQIRTINNQKTVFVGDLPQGMYMLKVFINNQWQIFKFIH